MSDDLVTIATFDMGAEAHIARGHLEAAGIKAVVVGEENASLRPLVGDAFTSVRLLVHESDVDAAEHVLRGTPRAAHRHAHCPHCHWENPRRSGVLIFARWICDHCGATWRKWPKPETEHHRKPAQVHHNARKQHHHHN